MPSCTFFGHREIIESIKPQLMEALIRLIETEKVDSFYVGNQGEFDYIVKNTLSKLKEIYPINFTVVLAYMPGKKNEYYTENNIVTLLPDGIEKASRKAAIHIRNRWMLNKSDFVVTYVRHTASGAAEFKALAEKQKKKIIAL